MDTTGSTAHRCSLEHPPEKDFMQSLASSTDVPLTISIAASSPLPTLLPLPPNVPLLLAPCTSSPLAPPPSFLSLPYSPRLPSPHHPVT